MLGAYYFILLYNNNALFTLFSDFPVYSHFIFLASNGIIALHAYWSCMYGVGSNITFQPLFTEELVPALTQCDWEGGV